MTLLSPTPLLPLRSPLEGVELWAKMEDRNFSGSIKARPALWMLRLSSAKRGDTLVEATSGNTGIALAALARRHDMRFVAVLPEGSSQERVDLLRALQAEIIYSPADEGSNGAVRLAGEISEENPAWVHLDQYSNPANPESHYQTTGPEIWQELPELTHFVAGLGTGGTLMGTGRYLREQRSDIQIVAAEPMPGERVQGLRSLGDGFVPPLLDVSRLDRRILVRSEEALWGVEVFGREGLFVGPSAGANLSVALRIASPGDKIVVMVPDSGERYLSLGLFSSSPQGDISSWW